MYTPITDSSTYAQSIVEYACPDAATYQVYVEHEDKGVVLKEEFTTLQAAATKMAYYAVANGYKTYPGYRGMAFKPIEGYALNIGWSF